MKLRGAVAIVLLAITFVTVPVAHATSTRADYIAQADPICLSTGLAEGNQLSGFSMDLKKGRLKVAARKLRAASTIFGRGVDQLALLERPPADVSQLSTWIDSLRAQVPILNRFARSINHRQAKRVRRTGAQLLIAEEKTSALVDDYGFALCNRFGV